MRGSNLPDNVAAKEVPLQQEVVHEGHDEQECGKAAGNEGHKVAQLGETRRGKLLQVLLSCLVTGVQPAHLHPGQPAYAWSCTPSLPFTAAVFFVQPAHTLVTKHQHAAERIAHVLSAVGQDSTLCAETRVRKRDQQLHTNPS